MLRKYILFTIVMFALALFVPYGFNTLKSAIISSSDGDVLNLMSGYFITDQIDVTISISILGI